MTCWVVLRNIKSLLEGTTATVKCMGKVDKACHYLAPSSNIFFCNHRIISFWSFNPKSWLIFFSFLACCIFYHTEIMFSQGLFECYIQIVASYFNGLLLIYFLWCTWPFYSGWVLSFLPLEKMLVSGWYSLHEWCACIVILIENPFNILHKIYII